MPDFERKLRASFISSNDGATPVALSRWLMYISSSCCFFVSMANPPAQGPSRGQPREQTLNSCPVLLWFAREVKPKLGEPAHFC
jgi:hypothetical protein